MKDSATQFAITLANDLVNNDSAFSIRPSCNVKVAAVQKDNSMAVLDLTPFNAKPAPVSAYKFFNEISTAEALLSAYEAAIKSNIFEQDIPGVNEQLEPYAKEFLKNLLHGAKKLSRHQIELISSFVKNLDTYCAIKAVESLLNSKADIATLEVAEKKGWSVHFDHLAIRCSSKSLGDAKQISTLLVDKHDYERSQVVEEEHYQFPDGWNAYPVYKILENGQVLRVFVDQSDADDKKQIIQHWNRVYGYTAHHLAMRTTKIENGQRLAVPLDELMQALTEHGVSILTPTGHYTSGLLLQVFTRPETNHSVPSEIKQELKLISETLDKTIENGKLLELVSRKEMSIAIAKNLYTLYGLTFDVNNPLHSAPIYTYFLPAQAAHVIKTSQTTS